MKEMRRKKVCFLGAAATGKTSLVASYSGNTLDSVYQSTLGVRITAAVVPINERLRELVIWDIKGESEFYQIPMVYLTGSAGCIFVADGTRIETLEIAMELRLRMKESIGEIPHVLLINKTDLQEAWEVDDPLIFSLKEQVKDLYLCSAYGGITLRTAIESLAHKMWEGK